MKVNLRTTATATPWAGFGLLAVACASAGDGTWTPFEGGAPVASAATSRDDGGALVEAAVATGDGALGTPAPAASGDDAAGSTTPSSSVDASEASSSSEGGAVATQSDAAGAIVPDAAGAVVPDAASLPPGTTGTPTIGGCPVFPGDNPWNTRIDDPQKFPVHPNSATYLANMNAAAHLHADWGDWSMSQYGIPWQTVPAGQSLVPMTFDDSSESDPGPYPFPSTARVEGGTGSGGDMHVLVVDTGTCTLYETYQSQYVGPGWHCGSGAKFDLSSNALRPDGWTSADAAGLPILPGLVRVSEVQAGAILHALRFTVASTQQGFIHPATHAAGSSNTSLPPMGLRLRLTSHFDLTPFTGPALVILTAMQRYGLILADNGGDWFVSGDSDDAWTPLMNGIVQAFSQVHGTDFEAVYSGPISTPGP